MTEENSPRVSSTESADPTSSKKRRKRKWDQPAEILVSTGGSVPGILPLGSLNSVTLSNNASSSESVLASTVGAIPSLFQLPFVNPLANVATPKINQQKIQDELIAREIVINDADSAVRYKLTKRQTQEEIQRCSGAVVITRGTYHLPNAPVDNEKPLYLHISAGSHLETTVDRIKAVDIAASMVEEIMKQNPVVNGEKVTHPFSISVFLGFETNPSSDIAIRIRGPNDQYVKHIMNETGATVVLRGHGSGNYQSSPDEERQPLHLFLSSSNPQSLEHAKILAENLLDTISREFGASRVSSNIYGAVPPPQQSTHHQSTKNEAASNTSFNTSTPIPATNIVATPPISSIVNKGTNYFGYGGIYPQATPLQQVTLALRQSPLPVNSTGVQATNAAPNSSERLASEREKRRRKFQELPAGSKESAKSNQNLFQGVTFLKPSEAKSDSRVRNLSTVPAPKKLVHSAIDAMPPPPPPPPPKNMPPPPPPKFNSTVHPQKVPKNNVRGEPKQENIPDTLIKLMEYGDDEDEDDETTEEPHRGDSNRLTSSKPFWAV